MSVNSIRTSFVKFRIAILFNGSLEELSSKISQKLNIQNFFFKNNPEPPHTLYAMSEVLGFETSLYASTEKDGFNFLFEIETTHNSESLNEMEQPVVDLSHWFAEYMKIVFPYKIEALEN